jgi:hypothetical protein
MIRQCVECGTEFEPKRKDSLFCGKKCASRAYDRRYKQRHPGRCKEASSRWRKAHPEAKKADGRRYREKYPEKIREKSARWYKANRERVNGRARAPKRHRRDPDKVRKCRREYVQRYPEKVRAAQKKYKSECPDKYREALRKSRRKRAEKVKQDNANYYQRNAERLKAASRSRQEQQRAESLALELLAVQTILTEKLA